MWSSAVCSIWIPFYNFIQIEELFRKNLRARTSIVNTADVEIYFKRLRAEKEVYRRNEIFKVLNEYESVFYEKLSPNQVYRIMKFVRILEGTPLAIDNALVRIIWMHSIPYSFNILKVQLKIYIPYYYSIFSIICMAWVQLRLAYDYYNSIQKWTVQMNEFPKNDVWK